MKGNGILNDVIKNYQGFKSTSSNIKGQSNSIDKIKTNGLLNTSFNRILTDNNTLSVYSLQTIAALIIAAFREII